MRSFIHSHKRSSSLDNTSSKTAVTRNSNGSTTDLLPPYIPTAEPKHSGSLESLHKIASGKIFSNKLFKKSGSNNSKQSLVGEGHPFRKQRGEQTNFNGYKYDGGDVFDDIPAIKGTRTHEWGDNGEVPHSVIILNGTSMQGNALYNQMKDGCVSTKLTRRSLDCNSITSSSQDEATLLSNACESSVGSASAIHLRSRGAQGAIKKQNRQARIHSSDDILELELNSSWRTGIVTSMDEYLVAEMNENSSTQEYGNLAEDELEGTDMHSYSSSSDRSSKFSFETGSGKNGRTSSQKYYAKVEPVAPRYIDDIYVDEDLDEDMNYCASDGKEDEDTTHLFCFSDAGGGAANYSTLCNLGTDESDISDDITDMPKTPVDVASNLADYESFDSPTEEAGHEQVEGDLFTEAISDNYSLDEQTTNIEDEIYRELDLPIAYSLKSKESGSDVSRNRELKVEQYISQSPDLEDPCSSNLVLDEGHVTEGVLACNNESLELQETAEQLSSLYISKDEETSSLRLFQAERRTSIAKCNSPAQITFKEAKIAVEASPAPTIIKKYADLFCLSDDEDGAASQKNEELQSYSDQYPIGDSTKVYITNIIDDQDNHDEEQRDLGSSKYPLSPGSDAYPVYSNQPTLQVHGLVAQDQPMTKPFQTSVRNVAPSLPPPARSQSLKYHDLHSSLDAEINGTMSNLYFIDESEEDKYNASQVKSEDDYIDEINTVPEDFTFSDSETEPWSAKSSPRPFPERNSFRKTHSFSDKPTGQVKEGSPVPYRLDLKNKTVTFFKNGLSKATLDFVGNTGRSVSHSFLSMPSYTSRCDVRMGKTDDSKTINIDIIKATDARSMTKVSDCLITKEMHELAPIEEGI